MTRSVVCAGFNSLVKNAPGKQKSGRDAHFSQSFPLFCGYYIIFCFLKQHEFKCVFLPDIVLKRLRQWFVHRLEIDGCLAKENEQCLEIDIEE